MTFWIGFAAGAGVVLAVFVVLGFVFRDTEVRGIIDDH